MKILVILGATASGKTRLAVQLAKKINGEILSADSRQVYRGLDIGTGKDRDEYDGIPCHLIDVAEVGHEFSLFEFKHQVHDLLPRIGARQRIPLLVGGTGLYLDAIIRNYPLVPAPPNPMLRAELATLTDQELEARLQSLKPEQHNITDSETRARMIRAIEIATSTAAPVHHPDLSCLVLGVRWERPVLRQRIAARLAQRLENGMIDEVRHLLDQGIAPDILTGLGLEYRFLTQYLLGETTYDQMYRTLHQAICQFAKRQETWFRRMERQGTRIHWLGEQPVPEALAILSAAWNRAV